MRGCSSPASVSSVAGSRPTAVSSAWARSRVTPGASRAKTTPDGPAFRSSSKRAARSGTQNRWLTGKVNLSGMTPTTVWTVSPRRIDFPNTAGSAQNRDCHTS